ncbi:hypothetical protein EAI_01234 [Harpegnathos saltator]|uniref:C2H2-type domain-containing protein n=1 Tax=Harpegnathos saltator TaxID=610380 RepID=E2BGM2_HARSA|nr:hypothetical protein EAI_01234 [Harpegnathos saltator]
MVRCYCFLCASDDGVFLEITLESVRVAFGGQIEACLSTKVNKTIELSNKICYKCAYELDQCAKFLQKSKKLEDAAKFPKNKTQVPHCSLCLESVESGHIFDITEDNRSVFSPLQKIRKIFDEEFARKINNSKLVCLVCRYNLDVLYDLKKLHEQSVNNLEALVNDELDYSGFPKVYTDVVNRKTTITTFPETTIYGLISSDSDSGSDMARSKSRRKLSDKSLRNKSRNIVHSKVRIKQSIKNNIREKSQVDVKSKDRRCDSCNNSVANGKDMYRFYQTGNIVCKSCWITMDPNKSKQKRHTYNSSAETKLCTVCLTDVLNEGSHNGDNMNKIDNKKAKTVYVVSDDSSQNEDKGPSTLSQIGSKSIANGSTAIRSRKRLIDSDVESTPSKLQKMSVSMTTRSAKALSDLDQPSTSFQNQQERKRKVVTDWSSDSDYQETSDMKSKLTTRSGKQISSSKQALSSTSEEDVNRRISMRQKGFTSKEITKNASTPVASTADTKKPEAEKRETRNRTRSVSISSKEMTPPVEFKSPKFVLPQEYTCDKCDEKFDTKLAHTEHKLTHLKQLKLNLERVNVMNWKKGELEVASQEDETISAEGAETGETALTDKSQLGNQSEEININPNDTIDDEDVRNKHKKDCKKDDEAEKSAAEENESQEDESTKAQIEEETTTSESQQSADATTVSNETTAAAEVNEENKENRDTKIVMNEKVDALQDQGDEARKDEPSSATVEDTVDIAENQEVSNGEKEDEGAKVNKDSTDLKDCSEEAPAAEKEEDTVESDTLNDKTIEDNKNKDDTTEYNKNYDENLENKLEDSRKDDEDKITKTVDQDIKPCVNLPDDSQKKSLKKSEEKDKVMPDISNETLNDEEDLTIKNPKKRQDAVDKENAETEKVITDIEKIDDNAKNTTKSNILHCETLDDVTLDDETLDDDTLIVEDSEIVAELEDIEEIEEIEEVGEVEEVEEVETVGDVEEVEDVATDMMDISEEALVKSKKGVTKETVMTCDLTTEEETPTVEENDIEKLIEENSTECEVQEKNKNRSDVSENLNNISMDTSAEIMDEVFDLAAAEVQKRKDNNDAKINSEEDIEMETLENISREIRNSADMPSLDPVGAISINDEDVIMRLN